jgi:hypothetical protein
MWQDVSGYSASLIADSNYDMLWSLANSDFNRRWLAFPSSRRGFLTLNNGLDTIPEQLADYVLKM